MFRSAHVHDYVTVEGLQLPTKIIFQKSQVWKIEPINLGDKNYACT